MPRRHTNIDATTPNTGNEARGFSLRIGRRRLGELLLGHTVNQALIVLFDYILYPLAIAYWGLLRGGTVMAFVSLVACIGMIRFYDLSKRDWLGIETIKSIKHYQGNSKFLRMVSAIMRRSDAVSCVILSIQYDPFITTAYMRRGAFNGMNRRDWRIFWTSWAIANGYWIFVCFGGVKALQWLWHAVR